MTYNATIFINYAKEDYFSAQMIYNLLKQNGYYPWLDRECLLGGQKWRIEIQKAIRSSKIFITLLSDKSVGKLGYVHKEIRFALDVLDELPETQIYIIPVRLNNCTPTHNKLYDLQWIDFFPDLNVGTINLLTSIDHAINL